MIAHFQLRQDDTVYGLGWPQETVVSSSHVDAPSRSCENVRQRSPSRQELDRLIENHDRNKILYREDLAMGLIRDDAVIERHLRRKLEFVFTYLVERKHPADEELDRFPDANADTYRLPSVFSYRQVYTESGFSRQAHVVPERLRGGRADAYPFEHWVMIPTNCDQQTAHDIERMRRTGFRPVDRRPCRRTQFRRLRGRVGQSEPLRATTMRRRFPARALILKPSQRALADEHGPAYLLLNEAQSETFDVLRKVRARGPRRPGLHVSHAGDIENADFRSTRIPGASIERFSAHRRQRLRGAAAFHRSASRRPRRGCDRDAADRAARPGLLHLINH